MKNKKGIQTEIDACYLYQKLAEHESDATISNVYRQMSEIEKGHAQIFIKKDNAAVDLPMKPSWRARTLNAIGRTFGYDYVLGALMDTEKSISNAIIESKKKNNQPLAGIEVTHVNVLRSIRHPGSVR